ncbi:peptidylprolyl isomerase [Flavilitoribacter nigricans DSM 23189 = NBRC 102662]|uniref:Peptidyl-prolyl cis-trans isomerase n=2 Tax=Flavilitoribacter TaxID=2762562 RepID=A0A2D0NBK8_FLAN2|nr:peptidylprolyl isomerase [Flavilitoribacter nigricans DSM 23189 = NBRC 102662]
MDSLSYSLGVLMAQSLQKQGISEIDVASYSKGVQDMVAGGELDIDLSKANQIVQEFMQAQQAKQYEGIINKGKDFLEQNGQREEVTVLPSGLQYEVLQAGDGALPQPTDRVTVHYHGTLLDGTVFDSSVDRGQPATFGVTQVIQGWVEGLQLMPLGSKWRLYIPYDLAYGERGAGGKIGPYSTLIFDVELLKIN